MTYEIIERSNYDGKPVRLYEFNIGTEYFDYCSDEVAHTLTLPIRGSTTFEPLAISDGGITQAAEPTGNEFTVTLPKTCEIAELFNIVPPSSEVWLTVRERHQGDGDAPVVFVGEIDTYSQTGLQEGRFTAQPLSASFNRNGARLSWTRQCPHALYDWNCRAPKETFAVTGTLDGVLGIHVNSPAFDAYPDGWFLNGFLEFPLYDGVLERRAIINHVGPTLALLGTTQGIEVGMMVTAYPGCNRTSSDCLTKFNNLSNFGGFEHMPGKSPFDGNPIY